MTKDDKQKIAEDRKKRNVQSAIRSRDRLKNETNWMSIQMSENENRMKNLERQIESLQNELTSSKPRERSKQNSSQKDRPAWFGQPF